MDVLTATALTVTVGGVFLYALFWTVRSAVISALRAHAREASDPRA